MSTSSVNLEDVPSESLMSELLRRMRCSSKPDKRLILIGNNNNNNTRSWFLSLFFQICYLCYDLFVRMWCELSKFYLLADFMVFASKWLSDPHFCYFVGVGFCEWSFCFVGVCFFPLNCYQIYSFLQFNEVEFWNWVVYFAVRFCFLGLWE